ncbi:hypothetical protein BJF90_42460 [Pseudonocardia sp. CNS-004]|nr:hypothetical protein BJF90_42460 [Pseudonocardia sp. CNS-004]
MGSVFGGSGQDVILPLLVVAGLLYLLHRSRGDRTTAAAATTVAAPMAGPARPGAPDATGAAAGTDPAPANPPAWDPLGAAPFAWDLPEPSPPPAEPPPRRLPVTPITLGIALIAGSATAVIMLLGGMLALTNLAVLCGWCSRCSASGWWSGPSCGPAGASSRSR